MPLNAMRFAAKCSAKWCKMRDEKYKNTPQWYKQNLFSPLKTWLKRAKQPLKSGVLAAKSE